MDVGRVIKALECCRNGFCFTCPYNDGIDESTDCKQRWADDALALLKAQEPKPPIITENAYGWKFYHCPSCGREFYGDRLHGRMNNAAFCDKCGQAVKWDG